SDDASGVGRLNEFLSGGEHCGDFGRVVRVIVVDLHSARFTVILKTAAHTVEVGDTSDDLLQVRAQECTAGDRGDPVERHVGTGDGHADVLSAFLLAGPCGPDLCGCSSLLMGHIIYLMV